MVARRDYAGGAVLARLNADITSTSTTIVLAASPGAAHWPTGANGEFEVTIDRGNAGEEKVLALSLSGTTLTLASVAKRGQDGTSAAAHTAGVTVEHTAWALDFDEANAHIAEVTRDDHTQYARKAQNLADLTSASTARTSLGLGTMATQAASAVAITGGTIAGTTDIAVADGGTGASTAANARTNLGLVIGTDVEAHDADLTAIAALTSAANKVPYATGAQAWALADFTAAGRALVDDADAAAQRVTLGLDYLFARKTSDETVTSSTAFQDDDELTVSVLANTVYEFTLIVYATEASGSGHLKIQLSMPAGASLVASVTYYTVALAQDLQQWTGSSRSAAATAVATPLIARGILIVGGTAGTTKLQWAQNTSDATGTVVKAGSFMSLRRVA